MRKLAIFRLVLSSAAEYGWELCQMDIITDYLKALGFHGEIYVKAPKAADKKSGLWELKSSAYGLVDNGRLWYRTIDHAPVIDYCLFRSRYEPTLYYKHIDESLHSYWSPKLITTFIRVMPKRYPHLNHLFNVNLVSVH